MHGNISMIHKQIFGVAKRALSVSSIDGVGHSSHSMHSMLPPSTPKARRLLRTAHRLSARSNSEPKGAVLAPKQAAVNLCGRPGYRAMLLLSEPTVAGINTKTPKQILIEFYDLYRDAQDPTFQVYAVPGPTPGAPPAMFKATVVCPAVYRAPGDKAFEDLMFEGVGKTKKLAEHDCADKAYAFIRTLPGLKLPSGALSLGATAATNGGTATAALTPQLGPNPAGPLSPATPASFNHPASSASHLAGAGPAAPPSLLMPAVPPAVFAHPASSAAPLAGAGPAVATPAAPAGPGAGLELSINEALLENMSHEDAKAMLREALRLFKDLVEGIHAEKQRHFAELDRLVMGHL